MIYIIGYMGSGKTTIAKFELSNMLKLPYVDTDEIQKKSHIS